MKYLIVARFLKYPGIGSLLVWNRPAPEDVAQQVALGEVSTGVRQMGYRPATYPDTAGSQ